MDGDKIRNVRNTLITPIRKKGKKKGVWIKNGGWHGFVTCIFKNSSLLMSQSPRKKKIVTCKTAEKGGDRSEQEMTEGVTEVLCLGSKHRGNDRKEMVLLGQSLKEREWGIVIGKKEGEAKQKRGKWEIRRAQREWCLQAFDLCRCLYLLIFWCMKYS